MKSHIGRIASAWILPIWLFSVEPAFSQTLDSFNPNAANFFGGGNVTAVAAQPDGRILLSGSFGILDSLARSGLARVNADGSLDPNFNPEMFPAQSGPFVVQPDGKIVVGGDFTSAGAQVHTNLVRLNPDGTVDSSFSSYANNTILTLAPQPDGRILVGGAFTNLAGHYSRYFGRLNSDGSFDTNFITDVSKFVAAIALQTNGSILIGGTFTNIAGAPRSCIARLNSDGSVDTTFNPGANNTVEAIILQPDNSILVGGNFTNIAGASHARIARLNSDGSIDASFNPGASNTVYSLALQANGRIIVGGNFTTLSGTTRNHIGRLNSNGTLDGAFNPGADLLVSSVTLQKDGKILAGGFFTNLAGGLRNGIGRLNNSDAATENLTNTDSSVTWLRGGSSPEMWRTSFEMSSNGMDWSYLGEGTRTNGGWYLGGVSIPASVSVRASGFVTGNSALSGFSSLLQSYCGAPWIITQPTGHEFVVKSNATISVVAGGSPLLTYQWSQNGVTLTNSTKISGANTPTLIITSVAGTNAGSYSVVVSNSYGLATSQVAVLSVVDAVTNDNFNPNLGTTYSIVVGPDKKVVIGGTFGPVIGGFGYGSIGRTYYNGTLDNSFRPGLGTITACFQQLDGKIIFGGASQAGLVRLNSDGSHDPNLLPTANGQVYSMVMQPDGKLLVAGNFTTLGGQTHNHIGRINADGSVDTNFNAGTSGLVYCMALQTNGQIVVGGTFTDWGGIPRNRVARLNPDGSLDSQFNISVDNSVYCLAIQPDGKILVGGTFFTAGGSSLAYAVIKPWILRLYPDGTWDTTFNAIPNDSVYSLTLQADGKILIGGAFTLVNAYAQNHMARLNSDGTLDQTYVAGADNTIYSTTIQPDGKVLVGGNFGTLMDSKSSAFRGGIGRFGNTQTPAHGLAFDGSTITWLRGHTSPELAWVAFDSSNDGINWNYLGPGTYTANGWQLTGISTTITNCIRAVGYVPCGEYNGSGWFDEDAIILASSNNNPPAILMGDDSFGIKPGTTNGFGFDIAAFVGQTVVVEGSTNLVNWSPVFTNPVSVSPFYFSAPASLARPDQFYRVKSF